METEQYQSLELKKVPVYVIAYLMNGEDENLSDEEAREIDEWAKRHDIESISPIYDEDGEMDVYFAPQPAFGKLACDVVDCVILVNA